MKTTDGAAGNLSTGGNKRSGWASRLKWMLIVVVLLLTVVGPLCDRVLFPEAVPGREYIPKVGQVFHSKSEGFTQRIVKLENGLIWSELTIDAHAPGPPPHVHTTFPERFRVERGVVSLLVNSDVIRLKAGEEFIVQPGTVHKPFNETDEPAVVVGPLTHEFALPERFGIFLTQAYGYFDAAPENGRPPKALLQMSRFSPAYDSWLGAIPIPVQKAMYWVVGPIARVLGYRSYYPEYSPEKVAVGE